MSVSAPPLIQPDASVRGASAAPPAHPAGTETPGLDPLALRAALAHFPQGVVVLGAEINGAPEGLVASTFTVGVSLEPALATVAIQHSSTTWPRLRDQARELGVSVIGAQLQSVTRQLAAKERSQRFSGVDYRFDNDGALRLQQAPLWLKTRIYNQFAAGDHDVVVLEILGLAVDEGQPGLVFHHSGFKALN